MALFIQCTNEVATATATNISSGVDVTGAVSFGCRGRASGIKDSSSALTSLKMPYPSGKSYTLQQAWFGSYSHNLTGYEHSLDFPMAENSDIIYAVGPGRVMAVKEDSNINCTSNCSDANYVYVDHGKGFIGKYLQFCQNCVDVKAGQTLTSGNYQLGKAGNTGWSTASHLHFEMLDFEENCSVKYSLEGKTGETYTQGTSYTSTNAADQAYSDANASSISGNVYSSQGITLTSSIPWFNKEGSTITISGSITDGKPEVIVFLVALGGNSQVSGSVKTATASSGSFSFSYTIPSLGNAYYYLGISSSTGGSWSYNNPPFILIYK